MLIPLPKKIVWAWPFILMSISAFVLAGCSSRSPERATINGQISFKGKPIPFGHIVFIPIDGPDGFYSQTQILNGSYAMKEHGPVLGENRVEIHGYRETGEKAPDISGVRLNEEVSTVAATKPYLPYKYNVASELTVKIIPGNNDGVDFHLE